MLKSLAVENFTIIKKARLEFSAGMTAITGETGAGKSILLGALALALGHRAQSHYTDGDNKLSVTLEVELNELPEISAWLEQRELSSDGDCIVRRTLTQAGRSRAYINGVQTPLAQLHDLSSRLIEIVGQNAQQSLMRPAMHLRILDMQCDHAETLAQLRSVQQQWHVLAQQLDARLKQSGELRGRIELLTYQLKELEEFAPGDGEFNELDQTHRRLSKKETLREQAGRALALISEAENSNATAQITAAMQTLHGVSNTDSGLTTASEQLNAALEHLQIANDEIKNSIENADLSEQNYQHLEQRLQTYFELARKHNIRPQELAEFCRARRKELDELENPAAHPEEIQRQLGKLRTQYTKLANRVSEQRKTTAAALAEQVTQTLHELNMQSAEFKVTLKPNDGDEPHAAGCERAEFLVRTNAGSRFAPLIQIASGGEMSRVSLAIQAAFAAKNPVPTLVFDEVDAGVGGKTAEMVGKLLKKISRNTQIFCVTHLPQVAAQADHHFYVDKQERNNDVAIDVRELSSAHRQHEIARMLAGARITKKSLAHAREMLSRT